MKQRKFSVLLLGCIWFLGFILLTAAPSTPQNIRAYSCEKHIDLLWTPNSESNLGGYRIYKKDSTGYQFYAVVTKEKNYFSEYFGVLGVKATYKISAYDGNGNGNESPLSDSITTETKIMTDEEFLDMVQRATFRYFYNYAHPTSGLIRERHGSGDIVTMGGSGFGIMALMVGIERGYITRQQGTARMNKILTFLTNSAQRFHGVYAHWLNGSTGVIIPFSTYDNGGDLVETAFMMQGLLAARSYYSGSDSVETALRAMITAIWEGVEWSWYQRATFSDFLYWHWSPNYGWQMNMKLYGWNETMICYILGIASPTYQIPARTYRHGWASASNYLNINTYFGYRQYVGPPYGGPLFFTHYSFLGFDPRYKTDGYANYYVNNRNQTLINRAYCIANPRGYPGYNENSWGLTASDNPWGYSAHEPYNNDNGTISPTAAISSIAYTPTESIELIKNLYRTHGSKIFGEFGFKDAFNIDQNWFATSYLAIDQGPIIVMIENHRSQLLWNNFMQNPEIGRAMDSIGFLPDSATTVHSSELDKNYMMTVSSFPNPFNPETVIEFELKNVEKFSVYIYDILGNKVKELIHDLSGEGKQQIQWDGRDDFGNNSASGVYIARIIVSGKIYTQKMVLSR